MRSAQLDISNTVINFAEVAAYGGPFIAPLDATIGSVWNGSTFSHPAPVVTIPQVVTRFQALAALQKAGLLATAQSAANGSTNPLVGLAFNNSQTFERNSPTVALIAAGLSLTSAQVDQLFITAATLTA